MKRALGTTLTIFLAIFFVIIYNVHNSHENHKLPITTITEAQYKIDDAPKNDSGTVKWLKSNDDLAWNKFNVPGTPPGNKSDGWIWIRAKLPSIKYSEPSLFFYTYNQEFQVYFGEKLIYSFGSLDEVSNSKQPGSFWHIIELPSDYSGQNIYFRMHSAKKEDAGIVRNLQLSSKSSHIMNIVQDNIVTFILASMFIIIGITALIISFIKINDYKIFAYFSLACICAGTWLISQGNLKQLFFYYPTFWEYMKIISQYMIPVTFGLLINSLLNDKFKKYIHPIIVFFIMLLVISFLLDFLNIMPISGTLDIYFVSFALSMIFIIFMVIKDYPNWNDEIRIFSTGFVILCIFGTFDIINWNFNFDHTEGYLTQWGITVFLISLSVAMIVHFMKTQNLINDYSEEIKSKNKILHESQQQLDFFSNTSHELRTPLNIILSTLQLINFLITDGSIKITGKETSNYFNIMKQNCFRLLKLVNNLIDINKIDFGYLKPEIANYDIVSVVEDITQSAAEYIKSKKISIVFDTDVEEKIIAFDPEKIDRIMLNLLSNAVKFSKPGAAISVNIIDNDTVVLISVKDTGIGIREDKIENIFKRFVQVDESFTRDYEGSGIGLSLVKSLVEMQGGSISCESEYGKGSTFTVTLPANKVSEEVETCETKNIQDSHMAQVNIEFSDIYS